MNEYQLMKVMQIVMREILFLKILEVTWSIAMNFFFSIILIYYDQENY